MNVTTKLINTLSILADFFLIISLSRLMKILSTLMTGRAFATSGSMMVSPFFEQEKNPKARIQIKNK